MPTNGTITAIVGATLIDGRGGDPIHDSVVVVEGERIAAVGRRTHTQIPEGAQQVDGTGKVLIPGLIDVHIHYFEWMGEMFLAHGVTAVKDVGNDLEWVATANQEIIDGLATGPRIYFTGNGLDIPPPRRDHFIGLENADMARRTVRLLAERGAIAIKIREMMPVELLRPVVDEAHRLGLPVTGHLRAAMDAREALHAGIDGLEHASGIVQATMDPSIDLNLDRLEKVDIYAKYVAERKAYGLIDEARAGELVRDLAHNNVALIPTGGGWWRMASERREAQAEEDATFATNPDLNYVPDAARDIWSTSQLYAINDPDDLAQLKLGYAKVQRFLQEFRAAGGRLLGGSDTYLTVPGLSLQRELLFFVDAGFSALDAISMTTYDNAVFMGVDDQIGSIERGKLADLVLLDADPLDQIENIASVSAVYKGGTRVDRTYHAQYAVPTPRPEMTRPLLIERDLIRDGYIFTAPAFDPTTLGVDGCC